MLTGLIIASEDAAGGEGLRAELPVAGQTVLEHQARALTDAGAVRVMILAEHLPQGLAAAAARLRRDAITVEIGRTPGEVAERLQPDERILIVADGMVPDLAGLELARAAPVPAILTLPDSISTRSLELIDATARWAGVLWVDGQLVRRTARMLGDWDFQSTLLRNAVQGGGERVDLSKGAPSATLAQIDGANAALALEQAISRGASRRPTGLLDRYVFDPVARLIAPRAMAAMIDPSWLRIGAGSLFVLSALLLIGGWRWPGIVAALLSAPVDTLGRHLGAVRAIKGQRRWTDLRYGAASLALLALGFQLSNLGWGNLVLAVMTLGSMTALFEHERWVGKPARRPLWLAEPDALAWIMLPAGLLGWWTAGLIVQAGYAYASLLKVQRLTARQS